MSYLVTAPLPPESLSATITSAFTIETCVKTIALS